MADMEDAIVEDAGSSEMGSGRMPTAEELLKMLDEMTGISDEDKESLRADLMKNIENGNPFGEAGAPPAASFSSQAMILFLLLALITLIFVFFGYKLYSRLIERERKREEKRRLKELKKKK